MMIEHKQIRRRPEDEFSRNIRKQNFQKQTSFKII
jgi:hypothetical protein